VTSSGLHLFAGSCRPKRFTLVNVEQILFATWGALHADEVFKANDPHGAAAGIDSVQLDRIESLSRLTDEERGQ
jgi:hypothetical protein